jgi:hypothetical protein
MICIVTADVLTPDITTGHGGQTIRTSHHCSTEVTQVSQETDHSSQDETQAASPTTSDVPENFLQPTVAVA